MYWFSNILSTCGCYIFNAALSVIALLPPPGGGSDEQFKDVLMVICTVVAAAYCYLHDNNICFDPSDFDGKSCRMFHSKCC